MPSIPVPTLKSINTLPTNLKERNCSIFDRITCNLFHTKHGASSKPGNVLERRTIESIHISTISSLVDKTKVSNNSPNLCDSQRDNYGLYALKYNRSVKAKRGGVIMNLTSTEDSPHHEASASPLTTTNVMTIPKTPALPYEYKHEHFQPCQSSVDIEIDKKPSTHITDSNEYYKIEFSEESGLKELKHVVDKSNDKNCENNKMKQTTFATPLKHGKLTPVPPRRVKNIPQKASPKTIERNTMQPKQNHRKNKLAPSPPLVRSTPPLHQIDLNVQFACDSNSKNLNKNQMDHRFSANIENDSRCLNVDLVNDKKALDLRKNKSELFRIVEMDNDHNFDKNIPNKNDSNNNNSDSLHLNEHNSNNKHKQNDNYLPPTHTNQTQRMQRKWIQPNRSSVESVDIFRTLNDTDAFNDFDEVLSVEPVVSVNHRKLSVHNRSNSAKLNRQRNINAINTFSKNSNLNEHSAVDGSSKQSLTMVNDSDNNKIEMNESKLIKRATIRGKKTNSEGNTIKTDGISNSSDSENENRVTNISKDSNSFMGYSQRKVYSVAL